MDRNKQCEQIIQKHHAEILRYCLYLLDDDLYGAEDCTQDVFLLLLQKKSSLNFDKNIRGWLYASADRIVQNYKRKQLREQSMISYEIDHIADNFSFPDDALNSSVFDILTDKELQLVKDYYDAKQGDRVGLAKKYGMTVNQLYKEIHIIREKLRKAK